MENMNEDLDRRQFIKSLALGGLALYGCSKDTPYVYEPRITPLSTTKIALFKTQDRIEGVKQVLQLLEFTPVQDKHVTIKPNFNTADPPPASTHNDTLGQIVVEMRERGASGITVAERSYQRFEDVIADKGIDTLASDLDFQIQNLQTAPKTRFERQDLHWRNGFTVPNSILNAEYIVSTCCLKTHGFGGVFTMSLKLSVGIIPSDHMDELHGSTNIRDMIAEINLAYRPEIIVMDGVRAFIDGGPSTGEEVAGDVMVAGTNRIAVDAVGVAILKELGSTRVRGKIWEQDQIRRAAEIGIGIRSPNQIEFVTPDEPSREYAETLQTILSED